MSILMLNRCFFSFLEIEQHIFHRHMAVHSLLLNGLALLLVPVEEQPHLEFLRAFGGSESLTLPPKPVLFHRC